MTTENHGTERTNPLRIAYYFIRYPCRVILVMVLLQLVTLTVDFFGFKFNSTTTHSYFILDDAQVHRMDQLDLAIQFLGKSANKVQPKTQERDGYTLIIMYKTRDGSNILEPSNVADYIEWIVETNNKIPNTDADAYYSFCLADPSENGTQYPDCSSPAVWDPLVAAFGSNPSNITQQDIDSLVYFFVNHPDASGSFLSCFEEDFEITGHSQYYRAFYRFGLPYPDINKTMSSYTDITDRTEEQDEIYGDWAFPIFQNIQLEENDHENLEVVIYGNVVRELQRVSLTFGGISFAAGSIITVFLVMCWHLSSLFLSAVAMLQILFGFPFAFAVYRYLFQVTFFDTLNTLVIFVILGIGADDIFVFVDAWVQSLHFVPRRQKQTEEQWLIERMDFTYRRSAKAMIVTTATTFFAFMATSFSPIMPIAAFGLWAACVVFLNYMMVISLFPALLSWWYQHVKPKEKCPSWCCCCRSKQSVNEQMIASASPLPTNNSNGKETDLETKTPETDFQEPKSPMTPDSPSVNSSIAQMAQQATGEKPRCMEIFLAETWANLLIKSASWLLPLIVLVVGIAAYKAAEISPLTQQEQWFNEDHYMEKMIAWQEHFDGGSVNALINVQFVWGLQETVDRTGVTYWDVEFYGKPKFDDTFNPSSADAQVYLLHVCDTVLTNYSDLLYDSVDYFDCWMYGFKDYGELKLGLEFPFVFDATNETAQKEQFTEMIGNWTTEYEGLATLSSGQIGYVDNELKFAFIEFKIPYAYFLNDKSAIFELWEDIMSEFNAMAPDGVNQAFQTSSFAWAWMATQRSFVISALQGIAIAVPLALVCLVLSTQNWIVSLYATSTIIAIIACEVCLMVLQGWELGISESIAVVMIVGFSVDYVVHLGNAYIECELSPKRIERLKFSLFTMGISVVSGALTTFGSGFWLIFPEFMFFKKFGILIMSVVTFSIFFSMVYFIACLAKCGPQGKMGNIPITSCVCNMLSPLSKCWCPCCMYICCCVGTIDGYYDDVDEDGGNEKAGANEVELQAQSAQTGSPDSDDAGTLKTHNLVVRSVMVDEVMSGSEMMSDEEDSNEQPQDLP